jgi:hypothetical protein
MPTIFELQQQMIAESGITQRNHKYNENNKYSDGNMAQALTNLLLEYNSPQFFASPGLYGEIANAALAITNPESFPDVSDPFIHNRVLIPGQAGLIARSIPNALAPVHPLLGATTWSSKIMRGDDRLLSLFEGAEYIRPTLSPPFYKKVEGSYSLNSPPPYGNVVTPTPIGIYRNENTTNMYADTRPRIESGMIRGYSEQAITSDGGIDYKKLFNGDLKSGMMFQKPMANAMNLPDKDQHAARFFAEKSARMTALEKNITASNLNGVINFDRSRGGSSFADICQMNNVFFPFVIVDMRIKHGVILRPFSEADIAKENYSISVDEDSYIGRIGSIYRYKNTSRKVMFNFFLIAESEEDLAYMNDKVNFLKNMIHPTYRDFAYDVAGTTISINVMSSAPIVEVRFGNYIYSPTSIGVAQGAIGMITSFDADPYRFNWEITPGKQIPQGFKISMEVGIINQSNPGLVISSDGTTFTYTNFVEISS